MNGTNGRYDSVSRTVATKCVVPELDLLLRRGGSNGRTLSLASYAKRTTRRQPILVTIRPSEQGPGTVDLAYWSNGDQFGGDAWRSSDSTPGRIIEYAEPELKCWMPMPSANLEQMTLPTPWQGEDDKELDGSGI